MFGKDDHKTDINHVATIVGPDTYLQGNLHTKGSVRVDGRVEGSISDADGVIIGPTGQIQGDVNAKSIYISGKISGNVTASKNIEVQNRGQVYGDIRAPQLMIEEGAVFEGNCVMAAEKTKIVELETA